jgi:AcrR family transcriptional regulator
VVDVAVGVIDDHGPAGLTLATVAERTGVAAPSLYKHIGGLADLRTLVAARLLDELTDRLGSAVMGRGGDDAVTALMRAARAYVREHPHRYAAIPPDPLQHPALAAAGHRLLEVFLAVLRGYGLDGPEAIHATRCLRAAVHGFVGLEAGGGFGRPESIDTSYDRLIAMVTASLRSASRAALRGGR